MKYANLAFCLCRADTPDGALPWFHTVPALGEYPGGNVTFKGKEIKDAILVIDRAAYDRILADFRQKQERPATPGILVDQEHFSLDPSKRSDAMAWAKDIREDADGLWTQWEFTPPGKEAWDNKILVYRSPVLKLEHIAGKRFRPVAISSIAMTNAPHFELSALAARAADGQTQQGDQTMKRLLALLGLAEDATEDEACAAVQTMIDQVTAATQAQADAQTAARAAQCDAFIAAHKGQIADVAAFRAAYCENPDTAEKLIAAYRAPAPDKRISARGSQTPDTSAATAADGAKRRGDQQAAIAAYRTANPGATCAQAEAVCRRMNPELFATPGK
jgi:Mu-like prophage I protein